ncbi:MAG: hypothetical protein MZV63_65625 [Marinilabiliales bacterium]|nr:hypothetical protein [Marinilabiliales bacterium]
MTARPQELRRGTGYKTLKVKVGLDPDEDFDRLRGHPRRRRRQGRPSASTPTRAGPCPKRSTPSGRWRALNIQFCEQPVRASDIGRAARRAPGPEPHRHHGRRGPASARPTRSSSIRAEACDTINIKLMKAGGICNSMRIAHIADAANMRCMVGCMLESRLALTAAAHVVASQANIVYADLDGNSEHVTIPIVGGHDGQGRARSRCPRSRASAATSIRPSSRS